jgi:hypothetical protein
MKTFRDVTTVGSFFSRHDDEVFTIEQNAEVIFRHQLPEWDSDIQSILRLSVRIPVRPDHELRHAVDNSVMALIPMPDLDAVRNANPCDVPLWFAVKLLAHGVV